MQQGEVCTLVKAVDIGPVLSLLDRLPFHAVGIGSTDPNKPPCHVVLQVSFPKELMAFVESLELGGELGRAIVRKLDKYVGIPPHVDAWVPKEEGWRRFQVPLISHPDIKMRWPDDGVEVHLAPGNLYEVRFDRLHEVINPTDVERIHLQIDQIAATI